MLNLLKDLWLLSKKYRRGFKHLSIGAGITIVVVLLTFIQVSDSPKFCATCHIMRPYYASWEESSHNEVNCLDCHYEPGITGFLVGKYVALAQVAQYITGTYGTRFWAEVEDSSCLREGCHSSRLLSGEVEYLNGIKFNHAAHLGELRRGKQLKCTSCHSAIAMGDHLTVTESVCFTCHFKKDEAGDDISDCTICHDAPEGVTEYEGVSFDHSAYLNEGSSVACKKCHTGVTIGNGEVQPRACVRCHPDRTLEVGTHDELHKTHITDRKVECFECHEEIVHGRHEVSPLLGRDCTACHGDMHSTQNEMYIGTGGVNVKGTADPMFAAGIGCTGCHTGEKEVSGHEGSMAHFPAADEEACVNCHGNLFSAMLPNWQSETKEHYGEAVRIISNANNKIAPYLGTPTGDEAQELVKGAEKNLLLVALDESWGAHNVVYTNRLIEGAVKDANKAVKLVGGRPLSYVTEFDHAADTDANCATRCHFGIGHTSLQVNGLAFSHKKHVVVEGVKCTQCHDEKRHGSLLEDAYDCATCHHVKSDADCASCHDDFRSKSISYKGKSFNHGPHLNKAKLSCSKCHPEDKPTAVSVNCVSCHHEDKTKDCAVCHGTQSNMFRGTGGKGVEATPSVMPNLKCRSCHTNLKERPGASTCTKCHKDAYANILGSWQTSIDGKSGEVAILLAEVKKNNSKLSGLTIDGESAETLYKNARLNYIFVRADATSGAHNQKYANTILKKSKKDLEAILEALQ